MPKILGTDVDQSWDEDAEDDDMVVVGAWRGKGNDDDVKDTP